MSWGSRAPASGEGAGMGIEYQRVGGSNDDVFVDPFATGTNTACVVVPAYTPACLIRSLWLVLRAIATVPTQRFPVSYVAESCSGY